MNNVTSKRLNGIRLFLKTINTVLAILAALIGGGVTLLLIMRVVLGEQVGAIDLLNNGLHLFVLMCAMMLPMCLILRHRRVWLLMLPGTIAFVFWYGGMFIPGADTAGASEADTIRVMTFNMLAQRDPDNLDQMATFIRESDVDLVAFQELSTTGADYFLEHLADLYPYADMHPAARSLEGAGLLSRYPLEPVEVWQHGGWHLQQQTVLDFNGTPITIFNVHAAVPGMWIGHRVGSARRTRDIDSVLDRAALDSNPQILLGDFNTSDRTDDYHRITTTYTDAHAAAGMGFGYTFPNRNVAIRMPYLRRHMALPAMLRLDYVFFSDDFTATAAVVLPESGGSDHLPVVAELVLNP